MQPLLNFLKGFQLRTLVQADRIGHAFKKDKGKSSIL